MTMANESNEPDSGRSRPTGATTKTPPRKSPARKPPKQLPRYKVILHNDDHNEMNYVIGVIRKLTSLTREEAMVRMFEAHTTGVALLLVTHKERAELYMEQFASCGLTVTIEPES
jgi:ATP-dependent Clp protease adaptor protein ClpS